MPRPPIADPTKRRLSRVLPAAVIVAFACGAPASFDTLTGGSRPTAADSGAAETRIEDPGLPPPRPLSPVSVTWVSTLRPKVRWARGDAEGARVELSKTRAFDGATKRFDVVGSELQLDEDLEPGFWFWRLYAETSASIGKNPSATWEMLVRPPGKTASTVPGGAIFDFNGDGVPDLAAIAEYDIVDDKGKPFLSVELSPFLGVAGDVSAFHPSLDPDGFGLEVVGHTTEIAGIDTNGDGFADLVFSDVADTAGKDALLYVLPGSEKGGITRKIEPVLTPRIRGLPSLRELGDFDGDGWGDVVYSTSTSVSIVYGTPRGLGVVTPLFDFGPSDAGPPPDSGIVLPGGPVALASGFAVDFNDAGLSSFAHSDFPLDVILGKPLRAFDSVFVETDDQTISPANALVGGDFDGDGTAQVAFTTRSRGKSEICVVRSTVSDMPVTPLCSPLAEPAESITLAACDLDGVGRDVVLVASSARIDVLHKEGGAIVIDPLTTSYGGGPLTVITPGRPGPAVWAATTPTRTALGIFEGRREAGRLSPPEGAARFGKGLR